MSRPSLSPSDRMVKVAAARAELDAAMQAAADAAAQHGDTDARTLAAWEAVENIGATIHRQSRILAGKSRGG
jgi:hypothetical protein